MGNFRFRLAQFMMGRNGFDLFAQDLFKLAAILLLADLIVPGRFLTTAATVLLFYGYFRAVSRNLQKRYAENDWYVTYVRRPFSAYMARDRKSYSYFKCPKCGQTLRAPKKLGRIRVTCSRCGNTFEKKV